MYTAWFPATSVIVAPARIAIWRRGAGRDHAIVLG
jgi:hypothetical protein